MDNPIPYSPAYISDDINRIVAEMDNPVSPIDHKYELMGRESGENVTEIQHLLRSIIDLLTTPLGSYPTIRAYGCRLSDYVDRPMDASTKLDMLAAITDAINRWEPRLLVNTVELLCGIQQGEFLLNLTGYYLLGGRAVALHNIKLDFKPGATPTL